MSASAVAQSTPNHALDQTAAYVQRCSGPFGPPLISFTVRHQKPCPRRRWAVWHASKAAVASLYPAGRGVDTIELSAKCGIRILSRLVPEMTSITIPLSDERAAQLRVWAEEAGLPPEEFLRRRVEQLLDRPDQQFQKAADHLLQKNAELYRRLA